MTVKIIKEALFQVSEAQMAVETGMSWNLELFVLQFHRFHVYRKLTKDRKSERWIFSAHSHFSGIAIPPATENITMAL